MCAKVCDVCGDNVHCLPGSNVDRVVTQFVDGGHITSQPCTILAICLRTICSVFDELLTCMTPEPLQRILSSFRGSNGLTTPEDDYQTES